MIPDIIEIHNQSAEGQIVCEDIKPHGGECGQREEEKIPNYRCLPPSDYLNSLSGQFRPRNCHSKPKKILSFSEMSYILNYLPWSDLIMTIMSNVLSGFDNP